MYKIVVMVSGGGTNLQSIIDKIESGYIKNTEIACVISSKKDAYALTRAAKHNIPTEVLEKRGFNGNDDFARALLDTINKYAPDLIVLAGYLVIVPEIVIRAYENKIINIHPSLIPAFSGPGYYGLKVHEEVLKRGCRVTGATVHFVDTGTDTGPIIKQKAVYVQDGDTPEILQKRVMEEAEWEILPETIKELAEKRCNNKKSEA